MTKKKIIRATTVPMSLKAFCDGMLRELAENYEVVAVSSPGEDLEWVAEHEGVRTVAVPMERHISLWKDICSLVRMIGVFRRERPYMVHSMTPKAGLVCMMAAWLTRVPVRIHTFTGLVWPTSTGLKRRILIATDWLTCACATHIIPEGQGVLNDLRNGGITRKPMKVLGYGNVKGVDMQRFDPARFDCTPAVPALVPSPVVPSSGASPDTAPTVPASGASSDTVPVGRPFSFLFVGRLVGDKGVNELVDAFTRLHDKYDYTKLVLVGPYENNLDPVSELTRNRIDANPAIVAAGPKFGDDLLMEYMKADCHVLPSYREGFPNTPMEAGALGLPNIVTDINGAREIVIDGENGLVVPSKDANALYDAMERILTDPALRTRLSSNARPMIASRFEKGFVRKCLMEFYREVM